MGKRSRQSQRRRRRYQKQLKRQRLDEQPSSESCTDPYRNDTPVSPLPACSPRCSQCQPHNDNVVRCEGSIATSSPIPESPDLCHDSWTTTESEDDDTSPRPVSSLMDQNEDITPLIVVDKERRLEVHISDPDYKCLPGSEVLKLSTQEYFRRLHEREKRTSDTMKCLRNKVETLERQLSIKEKVCKIEQKEAIKAVTKFWRNSIIEGNTRSGKMVREALKRQM